MSSNPQQLHAIVRGRVQGVNFRYSTQAEAQRLGLLGWVRNCHDGSVEVLAEGSRAALDQMLDYLRNGPKAAVVSDVQPAWGPASQSFSQFEVRW